MRWCVSDVILCLSVFVMWSYGQKTVYLTEEIAKREGYYAETHHIVTGDGYMLEIHRIPYKRFASAGDPRRPVVLLLHGLFSASYSFIILGKRDGIGYALADAGFDVWMGNVRGTKNSRFNTHLDPDDPNDKVEFFDFTFEEIGCIDLSEMVDFILGLTAKDQLHFVGHGAGATAFLVLNSMKEEYNNKFLTAHLLGTIGYQRYFNNNALRMLAAFTNSYYRIMKSRLVVEVFPPGSGDNAKSWSEVPDFCTGDPAEAHICELMGVKEVMGIGYLKSLKDFETAGASVKQLAHFGQNINAKRFQRWDHGTKNNLVFYGTPEPPLYNLKLVTTNVTLHYSTGDYFVSERDARDMARDMPNAKIRKVPKESFQHYDYLFSRDVNKLVTDVIVKDMQRKEPKYLRYPNRTLIGGTLIGAPQQRSF